MRQPDPLKTLRDELEEARLREYAWRRLLDGLRQTQATPRAIAEVHAQFLAAHRRGERLLQHLLAREAALPPAPLPDPPSGRRKYNVLVVDDHDATRYALSRGLQAMGFGTTEARAGAEALELAPYSSALVLDVHLPDLHGFEVCRLLRARPDTAAKPIVHVSSVYTRPEDQVAGLQAGADAYLPAPADLRLLAARLDGLLAVS